MTKDRLLHKTDETSGITMTCNYLVESTMFEVIVSKGSNTKTEQFQSTYAPKLGMDVNDMEQAYAIGEKLAVEIENEEKNNV